MSSAISLSGAALAAARQQFLGALPAMENVIRFQSRSLPERCRAEKINDALAACWHAWSGLVRRGMDPIAVGISGIAANACRYVRGGRRLATGTAGRGAMDVHDPRAQKRCGFRVISLDSPTATGADVPSESWHEWLAEDRRLGPCDLAAIRIDFARWLGNLPERKRQMASLLVDGHETGAVAGLLGVTPSAVSQSRTWLEMSWREFQGESGPVDVATATRPVGRPRKADRRAQRRSGQRAMVPLVAARS